MLTSNVRIALEIRHPRAVKLILLVLPVLPALAVKLVLLVIPAQPLLGPTAQTATEQPAPR